ncbi:intermembrane transport protein PqiB [Teredinibacter waterburyi]|uniref:PqiB family protein n=1 Tax=Teredinibacter waterburyi TaxID=1500538 RepID=UPI00165EE1EA|nr:MlaD family protein [Teredinibacter waterburyi]
MKKSLNKAVVQQVKTVSPVWIVPAIALIIALWLAVRAHMEKGVEVEILFDRASDIIANQTLVKLNEVKIGIVKQVKLSGDLSHVKVTAELDRDVANHISENSRFWVVTPRISAAGVSNLGTLISGVYIVMDPGQPGNYQTEFTGLTEQPIFESDEPGAQYILQAEELGSLDIGSPIYFRQIRVGEVTGYRLSDAMDSVEVNVFVRSPYNEMIQTRSRFWNVSGFGVTFGADGMKARMESLASFINGGIAFDNAAGFENVEVARGGHKFYLYPDRQSVLEGRFNIRYYYRLKFSGSVRGLTVGAPVEFQGIKIGEVVDVILDNVENRSGNLHVYISMEPQRLEPDDSPTREEVDARLQTMVDEGLRAQMKTGSLLTGSKFIDLFFAKDAEEASLLVAENYSEIPTVNDTMDDLGRTATDMLANISKIPFDKIGIELAGTLENLNKLLATLEKQNTAEKIDGAIGNLEKTLASANTALEQMAGAMGSIDQALAPDSAMRYEITEMAKSVNEAASSLELFLDELNRNPNALLYGSEKDD